MKLQFIFRHKHKLAAIAPPVYLRNAGKQPVENAGNVLQL